MTAPLIVDDLTVTYPNGLRALDGVSLRIDPDERLGVVGRSGSGKTTLVRAVLGLLPPDTVATGSVRIGGTEILSAPPAVVRGLRGTAIGYVPQDPFAACDPLRTVGHHVEEAWWARRMRPPRGAVASGLAAVGIGAAPDRARQHPHQWSGGMLQRATVVAATAHTPLLTLADEPTSALDAELADDALNAIRRRCGALLLISHDLALVARHADTLLVLAGGRAVEHGPSERVLAGPAAAETAALVSASVTVPRPVTTSGAMPVVASVSGVSRSYRHRGGSVVAVDDATLAVAAGEVVGIIGRSGSGKSTLLRLAGGMERPDSGTVALAGRDAWSGERRRPGTVMPIFQDPVGGLDRRWPLWRTLAEPLCGRGERLPARRHRELAAQALERVGLGGIDVDRLPGTLSVGQAQRVSVARALAADPALLVADEPTASLDVVAAEAVTALLREIADDGAAVLVVSHDRARLATYADRVLTMTDGRLHEPGADR